MEDGREVAAGLGAETGFESAEETEPNQAVEPTALRAAAHLGVRRSRRPPVAIEREAREVAPAFHVLHPESFVAALGARNHEVVLADLPALLGAARLYLALVRAEKTRRTRPQSQRRGLPACGRLS